MIKHKPDSPYLELARAFRQGKAAYRKGLPKTSNPYPQPNTRSRSFTPFGEWERGYFVAGEKIRRRHNLKKGS